MRKCSRCGKNSKVIDSREVKNTVSRLRKCLGCDDTWTTYEVKAGPLPGKTQVREMEKLSKSVDRLADVVGSLKNRVKFLETELYAGESNDSGDVIDKIIKKAGASQKCHF